MITDNFENLLYLTTFLVFIDKNTPLIRESELQHAREYEPDMTPTMVHGILSHYDIPFGPKPISNTSMAANRLIRKHSSVTPPRTRGAHTSPPRARRTDTTSPPRVRHIDSSPNRKRLAATSYKVNMPPILPNEVEVTPARKRRKVKNRLSDLSPKKLEREFNRVVKTTMKRNFSPIKHVNVV